MCNSIHTHTTYTHEGSPSHSATKLNHSSECKNHQSRVPLRSITAEELLMPRQRSIWSLVLHRCYSHGEVGDKGSLGDLNIKHNILGLWGIIHQFALDHSGGHPRGNSGLDFVAIKSYLINIVLKLARTYNCSNKASHEMHIYVIFWVLYFTCYEQF